MSSINRARLVNIHFNGGERVIGSKMLDFHGESILILLKNGGGKSVMIQLLTAPMMHKKYWDRPDRPFIGLSGKDASFIMIEWQLDGGAGFMTCGIMFRKAQHTADSESRDMLDVFGFISEYQTGDCRAGIEMAVTGVNEEGKPYVKSFEECRNLFAGLRDDPRYRFSFYNMNTGKSYSDYFKTLKTYGVDCSYWETVMTRINATEGGLTGFFKDVKTQQLLCSRWLFPSIEAKFSSSAGADQMRSLQDAMTDIILKRNSRASDLHDMEAYRKLRERLDSAAPLLKETKKDYEKAVSALTGLFSVKDAAGEESTTCRNKAQEQDTALSRMEEEKQDLSYRQCSARVIRSGTRLKQAQAQKDRAERQKEDAESLQKEKEHKSFLVQASQRQQAKDRAQADLASVQERLRAFDQKAGEKTAELRYLGGYLHGIYEEKTSEDQEALGKKEREKKVSEEELVKVQKTRTQTGNLLNEVSARLGRESAVTEQYLHEYEPAYIQKYQAESLNRNLLGAYQDADIEKERSRIHDEKEAVTKETERTKKDREAIAKQTEEAEKDLDAAKARKIQCEADQKEKKKILAQYDAETDSRAAIAAGVSYTGDLCEKRALLEAIHSQETRLHDSCTQTKERIRQLDAAIHPLENQRPFDIPEELDMIFARRGIRYTYGFTWLGEQTEEARKEYIARFPLLPQSVLMDQSDLEKLKKATIRLSSPYLLPVVVRSALGGKKGSSSSQPIQSVFLETDTAELLHVCDLDLIDPKKRAARLASLQKEREEESANLVLAQSSLSRLDLDREKLLPQQLADRRQYEELQNEIHSLEQAVQDAGVRIDADRKKKEELRNKADALNKKEELLRSRMQECILWEKDFETLLRHYAVYLRAFAEKQQDEARKKDLEKAAAQAAQQEDDLNAAIRRTEREESELRHVLSSDEEEKARYISYPKETPCPKGCQKADSPQTASARFDALGREISGTYSELQRQQEQCEQALQSRARELSSFAKNHQLEEGSWADTVYSTQLEEEATRLLKEANAALESARIHASECSSALARCEADYSHDLQYLRDTTGESVPMELPPEEILEDTVYKKKLKDLARQIHDTEDARQRLEKDADALQSCAEEAGNSVSDFLDKLGLEKVPESGRQEIADRSPKALKELAARTRDACRNAEKRYELDRSDLAGRYARITSESFPAEEEQQRYLMIRTGLGKVAEKAKNSRADLADIESDVNNLCRALDNLIQKLEGNTEELLHDRSGVLNDWGLYIRYVHEQLGLFDRNSSVRMGERYQQMFRITMTPIEKYGDSIDRHLGEFFDRMSAECETYGADRTQVSKYVSKNLSTEALFQEAFGFTGLKIHVCKIEATGTTSMKQYEEVASLSGAETFCSAFIILCCILDYQQRDENDPNGTRTRTLIMDNPFATITSKELLSAMMQLALKMKTQLICFTAVEDANVFSVFGNCYECTVHDIAGTRQSRLDFYNRNQNEAKSAMEATHWQEALADKDGQYTFQFS